MLGSVGDFVLLGLLLWLGVNAGFVVVYRRELWRLWREPVLRYPILIIESDDWGAGPLAQAAALNDIAGVLAQHRDRSGRAPVFSLALVLAVPDAPAIASSGTYHRLSLDAPLFAPILSALRQGRERGLFALQLHAMEHYWPPALMASRDARVIDWLRQPPPAATEGLPSHLQSRWVDAGRLPSSPHAAARVDDAVEKEVRAYARILGSAPRVVVPPTFVWTLQTEHAWAAQGIECIVTPGWRYTCRNADGLPGGDEGPIACGDRRGRITYLARTDYFEPVRGRDAVHALRCLERAWSEGRPCLLENHRDNFIGDARQAQHSLAELDMLYRQALARHEGLRFLSSWELVCLVRDRDPAWIVTRWRERLPVLWTRMRHLGRPRKLLAATGLLPLVGLMLRAITSAGRPVTD